MADAKPVYPNLTDERMPWYVQYSIAKAVFKDMLRFFDRPGELERFEAWKRERDQRQSMAQKGEE
ncbi:MAG: hypothetical protein IKO07_06315 [Clostridia bacterium]|nr:hypothetical protein [Clostridia bacterium]